MAYNSANIQGGAVFCDQSTPAFDYNIIAYSTSGEAIFCAGGAVPQLACNDLYGNAGGDALCGSDLGNNASSDPEFCGIPGSGNFYLQSDSPCTAANSACGVQVGALGELCGTVDSKTRTWGAIKDIFK
jgi:hypothetical protein